ncbi:DUF6460 domain-containing protein [Methylobacterium nonmethylotrophicum]|uniref:DUF6460 domain-containing protein n=1 Tax=Methylobacterium nonmethylotrophicum TaxID=1141884 RepID=A0A4Z0NL70_9HYPH|nr:DUF6460 domain-containing protein [Methylobacterium nonmethylotrophicum]TGD97185.1 hypothetical protein EU555_20705 [Methylobacterium nonmethylotrophicum]
MSEQRFNRPFGGPSPGGQGPFQQGPYQQGPGPYREGRASGLHRFLGGSPAAVLVRLVFLSLLVGAGMAMIGVTPGLLFAQAYDTVRSLIALGLDTFHDAGRWFIAGAVVVVPLWFLSRLLARGR